MWKVVKLMSFMVGIKRSLVRIKILNFVFYIKPLFQLVSSQNNLEIELELEFNFPASQHDNLQKEINVF